MPNPNPKAIQDFSDLEKEALKEISLEIIRSDLQKSLGQLHQKNMEEVGNRIFEIKQQCVKEIKEGLAKHIKEQLEQHFQNVIQSHQTISQKSFRQFLNGLKKMGNVLTIWLTKLITFAKVSKANIPLNGTNPF